MTSGIRTYILIALALAPTAGCDEVREFTDAEAVERRLREDPTRPGKVGAIVGVGITQSASRVTQQMADTPDPSCNPEVRRGRNYTLELTIERRRDATPTARWSEERTFRRDGEDRTEVVSRAKYLTEIGEEGSFVSTWRILGDDAYLGTETAQGMRWYRRDADEAERRRQLVAGLGTMQTLLDAAESWKRTESGWVAASDGDPLHCMPVSEPRGWIDRFVVGADVRRASFESTASGQRFEGVWELADRSTIEVRAEAALDAQDGTVEPPPTEEVVEVLRDRSLRRAERLLENLAKEGLVQLASPEPPAEDTK